MRHFFGQESHCAPNPPQLPKVPVRLSNQKFHTRPLFHEVVTKTEKLFRYFRVLAHLEFVIVTNSADRTEAYFSNKMAGLHLNYVVLR